MRVLLRNLIPKTSDLKLVKSLVLFTMLSFFTNSIFGTVNDLTLNSEFCNSKIEEDFSIICLSFVQVSIGEDGIFVVTPQNLLSDNHPDYSIFRVKIMEPGRQDTFFCDDIDRSYDVKVTNTVTKNSCWSRVKVEDKLNPIIVCVNDTLPCTTHPDSVDYWQYGVVTDNCDPNPRFTMSHLYADLGCSSIEFTGITSIIWIAVDKSGNSDTCYSKVYFSKPTFADVEYPSDTIMYCPFENLDSAGVPSLNGVPIIDLCDIGFFHIDDTIAICSGKDSILRTWTIIDHCPPYSRMDRVQMIIVEDTTRPVIICPDTIVLGTNDYTCNLLYTFVTLPAIDACSDQDSITQEIKLNGLPIVFVPGDTITLDTGFYTLQYIIIDDCGNEATCDIDLHIIDDVLPVVICIPNDTIGLGNDGWVIIGTQRFADLTNAFDNCGIDTVMVRRMSTNCEGRESDTMFTNAIEFCCEDVGEEVMVVVKVTDVAGNMNFCMIRVEVLDTVPPIITSSPNDTTVSCTTDYLDTAITGGIKFIDNCPDDVTITVVDSNGIDGCEVGVIKRTFIVCDKAMNCDTACQYITVINPYTFDTMDIVWPVDTIIENCPPDSLPSTIGSMAIVMGDSCDVILVSWRDSIISDTNDVCLDILRTWTVEDTCSAIHTILDSVQKITFLNYKPPILSGPNDTTLYVDASQCELFVMLDSVRATDCSSNVIITNDYNNGGPDGSDTFAIGDTIITFIGTDNCGQSDTFKVKVTILDTIGPNLTCPADTSLLCAFDFSIDSLHLFGDVSSSDNCPMSQVTVDTFNNLGKCNAGTLVRRWIATDDSGNSDTCSQTITIIVDTIRADLIHWARDTTIMDCPADSLPSTIGSMTTVDSNRCGTISIRYEDTDVSDPNDVCLTIKRKWIVTDSCSESTPRLDSVQTITILNYGAPILTVPLDITINTDPNSCGANLNVIPASVTDCSSGVVITNDYNGGGADASDFYPVGMTTVIFTATDQCGQTSQDSFKVTVIDDMSPSLSCPPDTMVHCSTGFNIDSLDQYGVVMIGDNCDSVTVVIDTIQDLHTCGSGTVMRTWTVTDTSGNSEVCSQLITVIFDTLTESEIIWPPDTTDVDVCDSANIDSILNIMPRIDSTKSGCYVLEISYEDSISSGCGDIACKTYRRKWTVIDSCAYDSMSVGIFMNTHVVRIIDTMPPSIDSIPLDTTVAASPDSCEKYINLKAFAHDCSGVKYIHNNSPYGKDDQSDASGIYPLGVTLFYFATEDSCCNVDTFFFLVRVLDTVPPSISCNPVTRDLRFSEEDKHRVKLTPTDFNVSYGDNCVDRKDLVVSFNPLNPADSCLFYDCDSLMGMRSRTWSVTIYVLDPINMAIDSCETTVTITDEDGVCDDIAPVIFGKIGTSMTMPFPGVSLSLLGSNLPPIKSDKDGNYAFSTMPQGNTYRVMPSFTDDVTRGVSTKDLVYIQKHLLGLKSFDMPEQYFAADVNNSHSVSTRDISLIRKIILGKELSFAGREPWLFIDNKIQYQDVQDPLTTSIEDGILIDSFTNYRLADFKGIKLGDVSMNTASLNDGRSKLRSGEEKLDIELSFLLNEMTLHINVPKLENVEGFQFEFEYDKSTWTYDGIADRGDNDLCADFIHANNQNGNIRIVWDAWSGDNNRNNFYLKFIPVNNFTDAFDCSLLNSNFLNEVYWKGEIEGQVNFRFNENKLNEFEFEVMQNRPNPFDEETEIEFYIADDDRIDFQIIDASGKVLQHFIKKYKAGYNYITIKRSHLQGSSNIYMYQLTSKYGIVTKKMFLTF